jgi:hypothetical protein
VRSPPPQVGDVQVRLQQLREEKAAAAAEAAKAGEVERRKQGQVCACLRASKAHTHTHTHTHTQNTHARQCLSGQMLLEAKREREEAQVRRVAEEQRRRDLVRATAELNKQLVRAHACLCMCVSVSVSACSRVRVCIHTVPFY